MIRECAAADAERICFVINEAAQAYKGVIPDDCWHEPYMPVDELRREMASMTFFGWDDGDGLSAVMGYQPLRESLPVRVTLIRHAYTLPGRQGEGIGGRLLRHLMSMTRTRLPAGQAGLLVGTWAANEGAIRFYERHGFRLLGDAEGWDLLRRYWSIPPRQIETSVVLGVISTAAARKVRALGRRSVPKDRRSEGGRKRTALDYRFLRKLWSASNSFFLAVR